MAAKKPVTKTKTKAKGKHSGLEHYMRLLKKIFSENKDLQDLPVAAYMNDEIYQIMGQKYESETKEEVGEEEVAIEKVAVLQLPHLSDSERAHEKTDLVLKEIQRRLNIPLNDLTGIKETFLEINPYDYGRKFLHELKDRAVLPNRVMTSYDLYIFR